MFSPAQAKFVELFLVQRYSESQWIINHDCEHHDRDQINGYEHQKVDVFSEGSH